MQIKINLKIFMFIIIFIITRQIKIYALLMLFALIHELGHLVIGLLLGFKPESISVIPTGFSIKFKCEVKNYNTKIKKSNILSVKHIFIALAGPVTNIVIIILALIYQQLTKNLTILNLQIDLIIYANILVALLNLLPIYPLDGGRILKETTHIFLGLYQSYIITNKVSNILIILLTIISSVIILIYKNIAILLIILYLWLIVIDENKKFNIKIRIWNELKR